MPEGLTIDCVNLACNPDASALLREVVNFEHSTAAPVSFVGVWRIVNRRHFRLV